MQITSIVTYNNSVCDADAKSAADAKTAADTPFSSSIGRETLCKLAPS